MGQFTRITVFAAILSSLALYLVMARYVRKRTKDSPEDFFLAKGSASPSAFAAAQTAYQLQMATIYPFFVFAFQKTWWIPLLNTLFYGIGIAIYIVVLPRFYRSRSTFLGSSSTIHAAIGAYHKADGLRLFSAVLTLIGFSGLAAFEIIWGATVFRELFTVPTDHNSGSVLYYVSIIVFTLYLASYISVGGQRANFRVGPVQLVLAYIGLHALVGWLATAVSLKASELQLPITIALIFVIGVLMLRNRLSGPPFATNGGRSAAETTERRDVLSTWLNVITVASLSLMLLVVTWYDLREVPHLISTGSFRFGDTDLSDLWLAGLSVSLLPLFFQFVDVSNWQRITGIETEPGRLVRDAKRGLTRFLIESPLSWLLPVYLGLVAAQFLDVGKDADPWLAFLHYLLIQPGLFGVVLPTLVFTGLVAIFMSTAEELLTAIAYTYSRDISRIGRRIIDRAHGEARHLTFDEQTSLLNRGRTAAWASILIVTSGFVVGDMYLESGGKVIGLFLAFYAPIVALAPSVFMPAFTGWAANRAVAYASAIVGVALGLAAGLWSALNPTIPRLTWFAPIMAFGFSWGIYLLGWLISRMAGRAWLTRADIDLE